MSGHVVDMARSGERVLADSAAVTEASRRHDRAMLLHLLRLDEGIGLAREKREVKGAPMRAVSQATDHSDLLAAFRLIGLARLERRRSIRSLRFPALAPLPSDGLVNIVADGSRESRATRRCGHGDEGRIWGMPGLARCRIPQSLSWGIDRLAGTTPMPGRSRGRDLRVVAARP